jgi:hypothetical protein
VYIYNHQIKLFILVDINVKIINKKPYHFFYYLINELIVEETPFLFLEFRFQRYLLSFREFNLNSIQLLIFKMFIIQKNQKIPFQRLIKLF